jgi:parallel beta-helix repeat protein
LLASGCAAAQTGNPHEVNATRADLSGSVTSDSGGQVEYWFEYGLTSAYDAQTAHASTTVAVNTPRQVSERVQDLQRSTTYHYRLCARDSQQTGAPGCGEDRAFTTANLECGDTVTEDVRLSDDLNCREFGEGGLVIGADGVDLDLGGHGIDGPLLSTADPVPDTGIDNRGGYDGVTIRNGVLGGWGTAVAMRDASFVTIRNVRASGFTGISISGGEGNAVRHSEVSFGRSGSGLSVGGSPGFVVADSTGYRFSIFTDGARIVRNQIDGSGPFSACLEISGNSNRAAENRVGGCGNGSIVVRAGSNNVLVDNEAFGSATGPDSEPDGIRVGGFTAGTVLRRNYAHDNGDDGIDVRGTATRLQGNRADDNGDFGIDAVAGVTDAGGNTASGNGNALQCRNVFCP